MSTKYTWGEVRPGKIYSNCVGAGPLAGEVGELATSPALLLIATSPSLLLIALAFPTILEP
jgi:hypothetical protein